VYDILGQSSEIEAMIDTGFSGYLTLPASVIAQLALTYDRSEKYELGDNSEREFEIYRIRISWDGQDRTVFALSTESDPLVGMSTFRGCDIFIAVVDGGDIRITPHVS
jgi:clan AA aspartic protease